jgi:hypothetical protein
MKKLLTVMLTVAMLLVSATSTVFAEGIDITTGGDSASADINLILDVDTQTGEDTLDAGDTLHRIWNVAISEDELTFKILQTTKGATEELTWNPATHKYEKIQTSAASSEVIASELNEASGSKTFTITNHSNFDVDPSISYSAQTSIYNQLFGVSIASGALAAGESRTATVTLDETKLASILTPISDGAIAGSAIVTLTAGQIYSNSGSHEAD